MQTVDHVSLGKYLLYHSAGLCPRVHQKAFLIGCAEPDWNVFSYLRGSLRHKFFYGHHAANAWGHILDASRRLGERGRHRAIDYYRLGCLTHYVADAFTFSHNPAFSGGVAAHAAYENALHAMIPLGLCAPCDAGAPSGCVPAYLADARRAYLSQTPSVAGDVRSIRRVCSDVFNALVMRMDANCYTKAEMLFEDFGDYGLVCAKR